MFLKKFPMLAKNPPPWEGVLDPHVLLAFSSPYPPSFATTPSRMIVATTRFALIMPSTMTWSPTATLASVLVPSLSITVAFVASTV